jgi:hypothetical protein
MGIKVEPATAPGYRQTSECAVGEYLTRKTRLCG